MSEYKPGRKAVSKLKALGMPGLYHLLLDEVIQALDDADFASAKLRSDLDTARAEISRLRRQAAHDDQRANEVQGMMEDMHAEREWLRAKVKELNRRAQTAEAGVFENIETLKNKGMPLGRQLAHAGYGIMERERDELRANRDRLRGVVEMFEARGRSRT